MFRLILEEVIAKAGARHPIRGICKLGSMRMPLECIAADCCTKSMQFWKKTWSMDRSDRFGMDFHSGHLATVRRCTVTINTQLDIFESSEMHTKPRLTL